MFDYFYQWDLWLLRLMNSEWTHPWLDTVFPIISSENVFKWPMIIGAVLLLIFGRFKERLFLVLMALCLIIGDMIITQSFKEYVGRPRPHEAVENVRFVSSSGVKIKRPTYDHGGNSFTSGHACNNFALAMVLTAVYGRWAAIAFVWAFAVSYSRVYGGVHWPSDLLGSWIVAAFYSYFIFKGCEWLWQWLGRGWFPKLYAAHPYLVFPSMSVVRKDDEDSNESSASEARA